MCRCVATTSTVRIWTALREDLPFFCRRDYIQLYSNTVYCAPLSHVDNSKLSFRRRAPGSGNLRPRPHVTCSTTKVSLFATTKTFRSVRSLASRTLYLRRKFLYCLGIHGALDCSTTVGDHSECNSYHIQIGLLERSPCTWSIRVPRVWDLWYLCLIVIVLLLVIFPPIYRLRSPLSLLFILGFLGIRASGFCVLLRSQIQEMKAHLLDNERLRQAHNHHSGCWQAVWPVCSMRCCSQ